VRVRKRDYRFTESDEEFYYREFLEQEEEDGADEVRFTLALCVVVVAMHRALSNTVPRHRTQYDEDDGFIASDDEWWGQDFRPGLIFERVLAARGRLNTIQIDLDEIVISDNEYDNEYNEYDDEDSLLSPAITEHEADAEGEHNEDLDFQRQIEEATRLSLLEQAAATQQRDEGQPEEGIATRTRSRLPERRQRGRATTTARPRSRSRRGRDEAEGVSTTDAALVRRPRVSIIDLTGVVDGEESSLSLPEVEPRPQEEENEVEPATTRRRLRRRRAILDDDSPVEDEEDVAPSRRRRTRRRLLVDIDEDEQGTTTTTTATTTSRTSTRRPTSAARLRRPTRRTAAAGSSSSSSSSSSSAAAASIASTDDSWLNEGIN
jgi:hypothetical protein